MKPIFKTFLKICIQRSFFYSALFALILLFSTQSAFAVKKDQNKGAEEGKNHKEQKTEKTSVQKASNLPIEEGKNRKKQKTEKTPIQVASLFIEEGQKHKKQSIKQPVQVANLPIEEGKNYQTKQTEKTSVQASDLSKQEIKKSQSLKKGRKSVSHSFRPLLIQGKKRLVQKAKDMKVDSGNIAESELFFIDIDFKKRIFEYEENK